MLFYGDVLFTLKFNNGKVQETDRMKAFFVFSGQGAQCVGMGKDLAETSAAAAEIFKTADAELGYSLSSIIFDGPEEKLTQTREDKGYEAVAYPRTISLRGKK